MLLQRLATGATGVKQARYRQGPTRAARRTRMRSIQCQCETMPVPAYEFRRGFCNLVLFSTGKLYVEISMTRFPFCIKHDVYWVGTYAVRCQWDYCT